MGASFICPLRGRYWSCLDAKPISGLPSRCGGFHSITIDEMVYSKDLQFYDHRSCFLERLEPFVRVLETRPEPASVGVDPGAFIIGGVLASEVDCQFRPQQDYMRPRS